jgi:hypothetical protein
MRKRCDCGHTEVSERITLFGDRSFCESCGARLRDGVQPRTEPVWVTQDGTKIPVSQMTDGHVLNTLRFLRRKQAHSPMDYFRCLSAFDDQNPGFDGPADLVMDSIRDSMEYDAAVSWVSVFEAEVDRRGLDKAGERRPFPFVQEAT